jgi:hypothetical protein
MGRFSPGVLPEKDDHFITALGDAIGTIRGAQQRREQQHRLDRGEKRDDERLGMEKHRQDQQDIHDQVDLYNSGYRSGEAPQNESEAIAQAIGSQRGNATQAQPAAAPVAGPQAGNSTQGMGGPGGTAQAAGPALAAAPSPIRQAGLQFYMLPGGNGYIDPRATPDARRAASEDARDTREHGQSMERLGVEHGYRGEEATAQHGFREGEIDREHGYRQSEGATSDRRADRREGRREGHEERMEQIRQGGSDPAAPKNLDQRYTQVQSQINDDEQRQGVAGKGLASTLDETGQPGDSTEYKAISAELDSLRGVRGRITSARGGDAGAAARIRREAGSTAYHKELSALEVKRQRAIATGIDPKKVDEAYARDAAALGMKHRGTIGYGQ